MAAQSEYLSTSCERDVSLNESYELKRVKLRLCERGEIGYMEWARWGRCMLFFFFQAEDGIRDLTVTGVQTCALPIYRGGRPTFTRHLRRRDWDRAGRDRGDGARVEARECGPRDRSARHGAVAVRRRGTALRLRACRCVGDVARDYSATSRRLERDGSGVGAGAC